MDINEAVENQSLQSPDDALEHHALTADRESYESLKAALSRDDYLTEFKNLMRKGACTYWPEEPGSNTLLHMLARFDLDENDCEEDDYSRIVNQLSFTEAAITAVDERNETPIHAAAKSKNYMILNLLVDKLMETSEENLHNIVDTTGLSLFHVVCMMSPKVEHVVTFLRKIPSTSIDDAVSADSTAYPGYTALHFAASRYRFDTVMLLIDRGADPHAVTADGSTLLHVTCTAKTVTFVVEEAEKDVPRENDAESSRALIMENLSAAMYNHLRLVKILLSRKIDVAARDARGLHAFGRVALSDYYFETQYSSALERTFTKAVSKLVQNHAINICKILYHHCVEWDIGIYGDGSKNLAIFDPTFVNKLMTLALPFRPVNCTVVKYLFNVNHTGTNIVFDDFSTALHCTNLRSYNRFHCLALQFNDSDWNRMACIDFQDSLGNTPFHGIDPRLVWFTVFVRYGADLNIENESGATVVPLIRDAVAAELSEDTLSDIHDDKDKIAVSISEHNYYVTDEPIVAVWKRLTAINICNGYDNPEYMDVLNDLESKLSFAEEMVRALNTFRFTCEREVQKLKETRLGRNATLYDLLRKNMNVVVSYTENEEFKEVLGPKDLHDQFPIYSNTLKQRFVRGFVRKRYLADAITSLNNLINRDIPHLCLDLILSYVTEKKLRDIIEADRTRGRGESVTNQCLDSKA